MNNLIFPAYDGSGLDSIDKDVTGVVARYRRDVGKTSTLGVLYTGRSGGDYSNHVAGVDGLVRFSKSDSVGFQYLRSSTEYPRSVAIANGQPLGSFSDDAMSFNYNHSTRDWQWNARYSDRGPRFRADSGFVTQVGLKSPSAWVQRSFWGKPGQWYTRINLFAGADWTTDSSGNIKESGQDLQVSYLGTRQTYVEAALAPNREYFRGTYYNNLRWSFYAESRPVSSFYGYLFTRGGKTIDYANSRQADVYVLEPHVEVNLGQHIAGDITHTLQQLDVAGGRLFTANLTQGRLIYHFNLRTFVRAIAQYSNVTRDPALYHFPVDRRSRDLFTQLLFSYKINPQTVFYLGYSDSSLGDDRLDLTRADRTLFLKIGYAWLQ